jgi:hypothetical protein
MVVMCYIGRVKNEEYDFDKESTFNYDPELIYKCLGLKVRDLFWDIAKAAGTKPNTKITHIGCYAWKMSKAEIVEFLNQEKYIDSCPWINKEDERRDTLNLIKNLPNTEDYLLVGLECY